MYQTSKKLILVLATFTLVVEISKKDNVILEKVLYIHYLLSFQKDNLEAKALMSSGSEINAIILVYRSKLGLRGLSNQY